MHQSIPLLYINMLKALTRWWKERSFHSLKNKPVKDIFTDIYQHNVWGGEKGQFYSGDGTASAGSSAYIEKVRAFIRENQIQSITEIGCGDFSVTGKILENSVVRYTGVDIVEPLIAHHQQAYGTSRITFEQCNAIEDELPHADLVIIRQVLQHLSNDHISSILRKLTPFRFALITEHVPLTPEEPNLDKITGPHIRMKLRSGVFIDQPPFSLRDTSVWYEYRHDDPVKGQLVPAVIRTWLVRNNAMS